MVLGDGLCMIKASFLSLLFGLLGGLLGSWLWGARTTGGDTSSASVQRNSISAQDIQLVDGNGRRRIQLAISKEGGPGLFFFDSQGKVRLVLGVYPPAEGELPFLVLNDSDQNAAGLFRLVGSSQVPFLIFKNKGQDRAILGLSERTPETIFLSGSSGAGRKLLLGQE